METQINRQTHLEITERKKKKKTKMQLNLSSEHNKKEFFKCAIKQMKGKQKKTYF